MQSEDTIYAMSPCPWPPELRKEIKEAILCMLIDGMHLSKNSVWNEIRKLFPFDSSSAIETIRIFNKLYYSVQKEIRENTDTEKELIVQKSIERYEDLYEKAISEKRYRDAKNVVDSLVKIVGVDKMQQMLKEDKDGNLEFHLNFDV